MATLTWDTAAEWNAAQSEDRVVHQGYGDRVDAEIWQGFDTDQEPWATNGVSYWTFDESSGPAVDVIASNDASLNNGVTTDATGILGSTAFDLDGTDDFLNAGSDASLDLTSEFTWVCFCNADQYTHVRYPRIMAKRDSNNNVGPSLLTTDSNNAPVQLRFINGDVSIDLSGSTDLPTNTWFMATLTYSASNGRVRLYYNDTQDAEQTGISSLSSHSGVGLHFGERFEEDGFTWDGTLDEPMVFDKELSGTEVSNLYQTLTDGTLTTAAKTA